MSEEEDERADGAMIVWPLERLARLMRSREHGHGLNPAQWEALRYLARANRFSNSPGALTRYLGATKGTISQTLMALVRKGFIVKSSRAGERRSVSLALTERGRAALAEDAWATLAAAADELGGKTRRRLHRGLSELLEGAVRRSGLASFGSCPGCRYFREKGFDPELQRPYYCMFFDAPLGKDEVRRICVAHEPGG